MKTNQRFILSFVAPFMILISSMGLIFRDNIKKIFYLPIGLMGIVIILERVISRQLDRKDILNIEKNSKYQLIRSLDPIEKYTDTLIVDIPAGASENSMTFASAVDRLVIVLVGEPTSFMDAYTMVKAAHVEGGVKDFSVVVNMAENEIQSKDTFEKFNKTASKFLDVKLRYVGYLPHSRALRSSIVKRKPLVVSNRKCRESLLFKSMSKELLSSPNNIASGITFFNKSAI